MNKQLVFSCMALPLMIGLGLDRIAIGRYVWAIIWLAAAYCHAYLIYESVRRKKAPR
jgi:hypothetical protein